MYSLALAEYASRLTSSAMRSSQADPSTGATARHSCTQLAALILQTGQVKDVDARFSREATEDLNASMPAAVVAAGHGRRATTTLLTASFLAPALGFLAAIFGPSLVTVPGFMTAIVVIVLLLIAVMVTALVIGLRAKRAFDRIAQVVRRDHHATLVRVANRRLYVHL